MQTSGAYTFHGDRYNDDMWVFTTGPGSHGQRLYLCAWTPNTCTEFWYVIIFAGIPRPPLHTEP